MSFLTDRQTLEDLNLLGKYKPNAVFGMFNKVKTAGGERLLESYFRNPLTDADLINKRSAIFQKFGTLSLPFPVTGKSVEILESFFSAMAGSSVVAPLSILAKRISLSIGINKTYRNFTDNLSITLDALHKLRVYFSNPGMDEVTGLSEELQFARIVLCSPELQWLDASPGQLSFKDVVRYNRLLHMHLRTNIEKVLKAVHLLDCCIAVAYVASNNGFVYAQAFPKEMNLMRIRDCRHPGIKKAVGNSVEMQSDNNVVFLTGANMAGKSTFMKSFAIAVFLAHLGFPVAASLMEFSVRDGIYTSINVPDDIEQGFSHFYAEVRRVKMVAETVSSGKSMVIIFDELFKGTNVKDAYDATLAVTEAFAAYRKCCFIISTHIIEVAEPLKERCNNLQFVYLPTIMEGTVPKYTYKLQEGVTEDRHGMMIINNEGIVNLIKNEKAASAV